MFHISFALGSPENLNDEFSGPLAQLFESACGLTSGKINKTYLASDALEPLTPKELEDFTFHLQLFVR